MKRRIVLIESNTSGTGRQFARASRELGYEPLLVAEIPSRYPYAKVDGVECLQAETRGEVEELNRRIRTVARDDEIAGSYSSSEYFIETASKLARSRNLPSPHPEAIRMCRNKVLQRLALRAAGVGQPAFAMVHHAHEVSLHAGMLRCPVVVKPTQGSGSVGVKLCRTWPEAERHAAALLSIRANERDMVVPHEVLLEEFISWPEYSAEMFHGRVIGITRKHLSAAPYFVETGHDFPATFSAASLNVLQTECIRAVRAVGLLWGPAHLEFRSDGEGIAVMEINPRLAGGFIPELVRLASGVNLIEQTLRVVAGLLPNTEPSDSRHASIRFLCPRDEGLILAVAGIEGAQAVPYIADVQVYRHPGDRFLVQHDFRDRVGHVIACAQNTADGISAAEKAIKLLSVKMPSSRTEHEPESELSTASLDVEQRRFAVS